MTKGKNYNRIVFFTTLSVYLGLVLVSAAPQVLAQTARQLDDKNKISFLAPGEGYVFTFDLNPIIKLNQLASDKTSPIEISGNLISLPQELTEWEIISAKGNQAVLNFLRKEFFAPLQLSPPEAAQTLFPVKEEFQSIEINKKDITLTRNATFIDNNKAAYIEKCYRWMTDSVKSPRAKKDIAGNLYLTNTQIRAENNQVFIVTRLPRAGIDSLLK
jgi:hypothetical protein